MKEEEDENQELIDSLYKILSQPIMEVAERCLKDDQQAKEILAQLVENGVRGFELTFTMKFGVRSNDEDENIKKGDTQNASPVPPEIAQTDFVISDKDLSFSQALHFGLDDPKEQADMERAIAEVRGTRPTDPPTEQNVPVSNALQMTKTNDSGEETLEMVISIYEMAKKTKPIQRHLFAYSFNQTEAFASLGVRFPDDGEIFSLLADDAKWMARIQDIVKAIRHAPSDKSSVLLDNLHKMFQHYSQF